MIVDHFCLSLLVFICSSYSLSKSTTFENKKEGSLVFSVTATNINWNSNQFKCSNCLACSWEWAPLNIQSYIILPAEANLTCSNSMVHFSSTIRFPCICGSHFDVNCLLCFCSREPISKVSLLTQNLTSDCNSDCVCENSVYSPVCGGNSVTYFSACHAGCRLSPNGTIEVGKARGLKQSWVGKEGL